MNRGKYLLKIALSDPGKSIYAETGEEIVLDCKGFITESGLVFDANKSGWLFLSNS